MLTPITTVASLAAMRKANEVAKPKPQMHTPQEFSRIKHERQLQMEEKAKQYRAAMMTQQKVFLSCFLSYGLLWLILNRSYKRRSLAISLGIQTMERSLPVILCQSRACRMVVFQIWQLRIHRDKYEEAEEILLEPFPSYRDSLMVRLTLSYPQTRTVCLTHQCSRTCKCKCSNGCHQT